MDLSYFSIPSGQAIVFHETLSSYSFALTGNDITPPIAIAGERWEIFTLASTVINKLRLIVAEHQGNAQDITTIQLISLILSMSSINITPVDNTLQITV